MTDFIEAKYQKGCGEYGVGNFSIAATIFRECVAVGHAKAATYLGQMYMNGDGMPADSDAAIELLEKGILWGDWNAAWTLAAAFQSGNHGLPRDLTKSRKFFLKAKELGCTFPIDEDMLDRG